MQIEIKSCAICGKQYSPYNIVYAFMTEKELVNILQKTSSKGSNFSLRCLDGRYLSKEEEELFKENVESCKQCGYCSFDISLDGTIAKEVVKSNKYKYIVDNVSDNVRQKYLCAALIAENTYKYSWAAEALRWSNKSAQ